MSANAYMFRATLKFLHVEDNADKYVNNSDAAIVTMLQLFFPKLQTNKK